MKGAPRVGADRLAVLILVAQGDLGDLAEFHSALDVAAGLEMDFVGRDTADAGRDATALAGGNIDDEIAFGLADDGAEDGDEDKKLRFVRRRSSREFMEAAE